MSAEDTQRIQQDTSDNCVLDPNETHQLWTDERVQLYLPGPPPPTQKNMQPDNNSKIKLSSPLHMELIIHLSTPPCPDS